MFAGHQVLRLQVESRVQANALELLQSVPSDLDFWRCPLRFLPEACDVRVGPSELEDFERQLTANGIDFSVWIPDVQKLVDEEQSAPKIGAQVHYHDGKRFDCDVNSYDRDSSIKNWMDNLVRNNAHASSFVVGQTNVGNTPIQGVKISSGGGNKPGYYIDGGIHAREWIAPAVVRNVLYNLVEGNSAEAREMLDLFDWYVVPVVNIDGYEFTHTNSRMWRKTRSPTSNPACPGVDPNRNSDIAFGGGGSSNNPCSEIYHGPRAFSENCVAKTAEYINGLNNVTGYWNVHSYGQDLFIPYGYTNSQPSDRAAHQAAATAMQSAIRAVHGMTYSAAPDFSTISGDLSDYIYDDGVKYSGVIELRDRGQYGFLLPASQICDNSEEIWHGLVAHARYVAANP